MEESLFFFVGLLTFTGKANPAELGWLAGWISQTGTLKS